MPVLAAIPSGPFLHIRVQSWRHHSTNNTELTVSKPQSKRLPLFPSGISRDFLQIISTERKQNQNIRSTTRSKPTLLEAILGRCFPVD